MRDFFLAVVLGLTLSGAAQAGDMEFSLVPVGDPAKCGDHCPHMIAAVGEITKDTPDEFLAFVSESVRHSDVRTIVLLDSPGGRVNASMELGLAFRKVGAATVVARANQDAQLGPARCLSACVYALMGGRKRVVPPHSQVGVHRMFTYQEGRDPAGGHERTRHYDDGEMRATLSRYSRSMGVSSGLIDFAESTPSDTVRILSQAEIARWRLGVPKL